MVRSRPNLKRTTGEGDWLQRAICVQRPFNIRFDLSHTRSDCIARTNIGYLLQRYNERQLQNENRIIIILGDSYVGLQDTATSVELRLLQNMLQRYFLNKKRGNRK